MYFAVKCVTGAMGRAIVQAISHRLPNEVARVRSHVKTIGICDRQGGNYVGFLRVFEISVAISHSTDYSTLIAIIIIINHPERVRYAKEWSTYQVVSVLPHTKQQQQQQILVSESLNKESVKELLTGVLLVHNRNEE
jgi:uncharacterized membrane protein